MVTIYSVNNVAVLSVDVDDKSYRYRALKGEHSLMLYFALAEYVDIPVGSWVEYQSQRYTLMTPSSMKMVHTRNYEYTLELRAASARLESYVFRNMDNQQLSFSYTAKPQEHLDMLVRNLNARDGAGVWTAGECVSGDQRVVNYDYMTCAEALEAMATEFNTEWEIDGHVVALHKVEYNKQQPLEMGYGKGRGFRSGVGRSGNSQPVDVLYLQTSDRNIVYSKYGSKTLMLPPAGSLLRYDGNEFVETGGRQYVVCRDRYSIKRADRAATTGTEAYLDATDIYPTMEHVVTSVDAEKPNVFSAADIPANLNYRNCRIDGEVMTIIFQSGELAGREFDIVQTDKALTGYVHETRTFTIVRNDDDGEGYTIPNETLRPAVGDKFKVFYCSLPDVYVCDDETRTGASWELFKAAIKELYDNEDQKYTFTGELDPVWASRNWLNLGGKYLRLGGYIRFTDERWQKEPIDIRIVGIKDYVNNPHAPELELSNDEVSSHVASEIKQIQSDSEVSVRDSKRESITYSKRRWQDAKATMEMLAEAMGDYDAPIKPVSVQTLFALIGGESLQFQFETAAGAATEPQFAFSYVTKQFSVKATAGTLVLHHLTYGNDTLTTAAEGKYKFTMSEYTSAVLDEPTASYYLYAKCSLPSSGYLGTGEFILTEDAKEMTGADGYLYFLVGTLLAENEEGDRSYQSVYGYTEISGGRITTELIRSADGKSFFNLLLGSLRAGDDNSYIAWNENGDGRLKIRGAVSVSGSGVETPTLCPRGAYSQSTTYYYGDLVTFNGSTYYCKSKAAAGVKGKVPTDSGYWSPFAAKGGDFTIRGYYPTLAALRSAVPNPQGGDAYGVGAGEPYDIYIWDELNGVWVNNGTLQGAKGDAGVGIESVVAEYTMDSQGVNPPASGWSSQIPENVPAGWYLWTRTHTTYTDGTATDAYLSARMGSNGTDGLSVACPFAGTYSSTKTYYGNNKRTDIVYYNGVYWIAKSNGTDNRTFSGKTPSSSSAYWASFGASFDNIATGFFFAELAYINNLGVYHLRTNPENESGKHVIINENNEQDIRIYNGDNDEKARLTGESIGTLASVMDTIDNSPISSVQTNITIAPSIYNVSWVAYETAEFDVAADDSLAIRDLQFRIRMLAGIYGARYSGVAVLAKAVSVSGASVDFTLAEYRYSDTIVVGKNLDTLRNSSEFESVSYTDFFAAGASRMKVQLIVKADVVAGIDDISPTSPSETKPMYLGWGEKRVVLARKAKRKTIIGSDGMYVFWGVDKYVFISANEQIQMRCGNAGVSMSGEDGGRLVLRIRGVDYEAIESNGQLVLTEI